MRTINAETAKGIVGNVVGNNVSGTIDVVLYAAKRDGLSEVIISRDTCPAVGDDEFWGNDSHLKVIL